MKSFLHEVAEAIHQHYKLLDEVTIVFPNRRAILYFRKHLSALLNRPAFSPTMVTIEEFIASHSSLKVIDKLELIHQMYEVYHEVLHHTHSDEERKGLEAFDQFYFWGEMLLRDFEEVDKYMIDATHLFKDLSHQKELDAIFDFLTEEQRDFLQRFWGNFDENLSVNKKKFIYIWKQLAQVQKTFKGKLLKEGVAYEGMLQREVAEKLRAETAREKAVAPGSTVHGNLVFAGFNALTKAEETVISYYVERYGAQIYWDMDAYYVNDNTQEAGRYFREYQSHPILGKTFPANAPSFIKNSSLNKDVLHLYGAAQPIGQVKLMAEVLQKALQEGMVPEETLIVLPDEKLLIPVLHGVSGKINNINVTMGFPLSSTPLSNLIELLFELQINARNNFFNHRAVLALLNHPYVVAVDPALANAKRKEILKQNWVSIPHGWLDKENPLHHQIFRQILHDNTADFNEEIITYVQSIIAVIGGIDTLADIDKEFVFRFYTFFNRMSEVLSKDSPRTREEKLSSKQRKEVFKSFLRLFRQLMKTEKIPFAGEPLKGLQIMGVLETRNLDFKNVFILSLNEGAFPSLGNSGTYIPFNIRKAYGLPTVEHQDAIYAYLFYRVLQRAQHIHLFYNSETDVLGQGEMSRYLQQLLHESRLPVERHVLHNVIQPNAVLPITIEKDALVQEQLAKHCLGQRHTKELTPTALNDYLECRLKFYFRHVARIKEPNMVEEDLDARVLGNFVHKVMELFYQQIMRSKSSNVIERHDLEGCDKMVNAIIDRIFIEAYKLDHDKPVVYEGQRLVVKEVVKQFTDRIIAMDREYAPFIMEAIESRELKHHVQLSVSGEPVVVLGGIIDRADRKDDLLRVIDYKTGKDSVEMKGSVKDLFNREGNRNKAAFQTLVYALLYKHNYKKQDVRIVPGLLNRLNLFDEDFRFGLKAGDTHVSDVTPLLPDFENELKSMLEELYNTEVPFDQTQNLDICQYCPYRSVCYR